MGVLLLPGVQRDEENIVKKATLLAIAVLAFVAGCGNQGDKAAKTQPEPKWKGAPYRLELDTQAAKPNPAGITIPAIKYTANPDDLQTRAILAVRFDGADTAKNAPLGNRMIMAPQDIRGVEGTLPADYMDTASKQLATFLGSYCIKGKVKISVALVRSSVDPHADDAALEAKRLSDWLPIELMFKNPHARC
jgi:hypothetical protein